VSLRQLSRNCHETQALKAAVQAKIERRTFKGAPFRLDTASLSNRFEQQQIRVLEQARQVRDEAGGFRTVDQAVIERE